MEFNIELFSEELRRQMSARKKSFRDLESETGLSRSTVNDVTNEKRRMTMETFLLLLSWMGFKPTSVELFLKPSKNIFKETVMVWPCQFDIRYMIHDSKKILVEDPKQKLILKADKSTSKLFKRLGSQTLRELIEYQINE